jgi:hypothetical protein
MDTGGGEWAAARQMQLARSFAGGEIDGVLARSTLSSFVRC